MRVRVTDLLPNAAVNARDVDGPSLGATMMAMSIGEIAIILILVLMIVPAVGFGILRSRWDRQGGRRMVARARIIMLSSLFGGVAIMLVGQETNVWEIRDVGICILVVGVAASIVQIIVAGAGK
jgi:hypothetical protein